jgi:putative cell wall-binding protein/streptogramin lyase
MDIPSRVAQEQPILPDQMVAAVATPEIQEPSRWGRIAGAGMALVSLLSAGQESAAHAASVSGRIAGPDRYATAVEISEQAFPGPVDTVYLASGNTYADALSAGPVAALEDAPLLLTDKSTLPSVVASELGRLSPDEIVVVGGTGAVSTEVAEAASRAANGSEVERVAGQNRYETAVALVERAFGGASGDTLYVATGEAFPDALSGAAAAAANGQALLLTPSNSVPEEVSGAIRALQPSRIALLGGTGALSASVETQLDDIAPVTRLAGGDRFTTSAAVANFAFGANPDSAYLATGEAFPDALAGSVLAAKTDRPLVLTKKDCLPESVSLYVEDAALTVLGGPNAVSDGVNQECVIWTPVRFARREAYHLDVSRAPSDVYPAKTSGAVLVAMGSTTRPGLPFEIQRLGTNGSLLDTIKVPDQLSQVAESSDGAIWYGLLHSPRIGRRLPNGLINYYDITTRAGALEIGPDGSVWFTQSNDIMNPNDNKSVGRIKPDGAVELFDTGGAGNMVVMADGTVWFSRSTMGDQGGKTILTQMQPNGTMVDYPLTAHADNVYNGIASIFKGPDSEVWFIQAGEKTATVNKIVNGQSTKLFTLPNIDGGTPEVGVATLGRDGNIWIVAHGTAGDGRTQVSRVFRITPGGQVQSYPADNDAYIPPVADRDGNIWYALPNKNVIETIYIS